MPAAMETETATGAWHHRQKFVSDEDVIGLNPVRAHQQPPGQALFEFVDPVARRSLSCLRKIALQSQVQARTQLARCLNSLPESLRLYFEAVFPGFV